MIKHSLKLLAAAGFAALAAPAMADVEIRVDFGSPPPAVLYAPPPRVEYLPAPQHGQVWVPGRWVWDYGRYVWTGGYWVVAQPVVRPLPPRYLPSHAPAYGHHHHRHEWREWREREHERRQDPRSYPHDTPRGSMVPRR